MATRALIAYLDAKDGNPTLTTTYNHYDGYPENLGKGLENYYDDNTKANEIANVGYISFLDGDSGEYENTSSNKQSPKKIQLPSNFNDAMMEIAEQIDGVGGDYGYVWCNENEEWITIKNNGIRSMVENLEMALAHLKDKFEMMPERPDQTMEAKEEVKEGYYGNTNVESYIQTIGYESFEDFFNDNPGAEDALISWIESVPDFRKMLNSKETTPEIPGFEGTRDALGALEESFVRKLQHRAGIIK